MKRKRSHYQKNEPILEGLLQKLRFLKVAPYIYKNVKVLDLGCGYNGALLRKFANKISEGVGIDISINKKRQISKIKLISSRLDRPLTISHNHFGIVTSLAVTEHLQDPTLMYKSAFGALKKNGLFILTTPSPTAKPILEFLALKLGLISRQEIEDHKKYYNKEELKDLLKSAGFKENNITIKPFGFGLNTLAIAKK